MRIVRLLEIASEYGAGMRGPSLGIASVRIAAIGKRLRSFFRTESARIVTRLDVFFEEEKFPRAKRIDKIVEIFDQVVPLIKDTLSKGQVPFVIDGDHSSAAAVIAGLRLAAPEKKLGVIWIDAHGDIHSPYTSQSGNLHGMPLSICLNLLLRERAVTQASDGKKLTDPSPEVLDYWHRLCNYGDIAPKINAEDIVYIGIRDLEPQEWNVIKELGIRYYSIEDIDRRGTEAVIGEVLAYLDSCDHFHVSFDVDSMDEALVPGTGTPVGKGLSSTQAMEFLEAFWQSEKLGCMEFTEINPLLDRGNETSELVVSMIDNLLDVPH